MATGLTVSDVIAKLHTAVGPTWKDSAWDGLQSGSMDATVTGIAVGWSPGLALLKEAVARSCNLILVKDPVYWYEKEDPLKKFDSATSRFAEGMVGSTQWDTIAKTDLYRIKRDYIAAHQLNIYRISENWDGNRSLAMYGFLRALGWKQTESLIADPRFPNARTAIVQIPADDLLHVAQHAKKSVSASSTRVLGDPAAKVAKIAVHSGFLTIYAATKIGLTPDLDAFLTGETCEWEAFTYAEDWISSGKGKGFIMTGLAPASNAAAHEVAAWVQQTLPSAKVEFLAATDPLTPVHAGGLRS